MSSISVLVVCILIYIERAPSHAKTFSQWVHWCGLSPVCVCVFIWYIRSLSAQKPSHNDWTDVVLLCVYHHMLCKIIFNCKIFSQCLPWYGSSPVCIMKWYFKWIPHIYDVLLLRCQLNLGNGWWCQRRIATIPYKEVNVVIHTPFGTSMLAHC